MKAKIGAFIAGVIEFKSSITSHYPESLITFYDLGREMAHRLTFRKFESS